MTSIYKKNLIKINKLVVGLIASIVQLIDTISKAINYLNDVKDAPKDRNLHEKLAVFCCSSQI